MQLSYWHNMLIQTQLEGPQKELSALNRAEQPPQLLKKSQTCPHPAGLTSHKEDLTRRKNKITILYQRSTLP
jgi:hypothetical protein